MADVTFIVHGEWLNAIDKLPVEKQDAIIADIVRYGVERQLEHEDNADISSIVNVIKGRIDFSKRKYEATKMSRGRPMKVDNREIWLLAKQGMKSKEIADALGIAKTTVDHSDGWKRRKEENL